jgi:lysophospholipase L1-like esterase
LRVKKILLLIGSVCVCLLLVEAALRLSGYSHFNPSIADPQLGYALRPNASGWWRKEGAVFVTINSAGMRDREHVTEKPADTFRIAVLGDSFAEAFQVPAEKAFWSVLEQKANECASDQAVSYAGKRVEVLNFGVSGFSTARELIQLREHVWQYEPDLVLLLITTRNDIRDNSLPLSRYGSAPLPYFVYRDGQLVSNNSFLNARNQSFSFRFQQSWAGQGLNWLRTHSRLLGLVDAAREGYDQRTEATTNEIPGSEAGLDDEVFREPRDAAWDDAWKVTEALIVQMRDEVTARGAQFLVVTGSTGIQVSPDAAIRDAYMKRLGVDSLFYPEERIKALGEREHFDILNLAPLLLDYAVRNGVFLHGSDQLKNRGHWNEAGHRVVGEILAARICGK